jgi:hypothetical protein
MSPNNAAVTKPCYRMTCGTYEKRLVAANVHFENNYKSFPFRPYIVTNN